MKEKVEKILKNIYLDIGENRSADISLMTGQSGILLFKYELCKYFGKESDLNSIGNELQELAEKSILDIELHSSFCTGMAGVNWAFNYFSKKSLISVEDLDFLCENDSRLEEDALMHLQQGNYDFLHGSIGILYYILFKESNAQSTILPSFFEELNANWIYKNSTKIILPNFDLSTFSVNQNEVNLGLAHGIPSLLKFCIQCYKKNVCQQEAKRIANQIMEYLLEHANSNKAANYFPNKISLDNESDSFSRLAWCYGDLGLAYILLQSGLLFKEQKVIDFAMLVLLKCTKRTTFLETKVMDAGFCHGSTGIAHIFNKLYLETKVPSFRSASNYWIERTIQYAMQNDGIIGFKKYNSIKNEYESCDNLLEGNAGIGLALLSYFTEDFDWDYCLMLNT